MFLVREHSFSVSSRTYKKTTGCPLDDLRGELNLGTMSNNSSATSRVSALLSVSCEHVVEIARAAGTALHTPGQLRGENARFVKEWLGSLDKETTTLIGEVCEAEINKYDESIQRAEDEKTLNAEKRLRLVKDRARIEGLVISLGFIAMHVAPGDDADATSEAAETAHAYEKQALLLIKSTDQVAKALLQPRKLQNFHT